MIYVVRSQSRCCRHHVLMGFYPFWPERIDLLEEPYSRSSSRISAGMTCTSPRRLGSGRCRVPLTGPVLKAEYGNYAQIIWKCSSAALREQTEDQRENRRRCGVLPKGKGRISETGCPDPG